MRAANRRALATVHMADAAVVEFEGCAARAHRSHRLYLWISGATAGTLLAGERQP